MTDKQIIIDGVYVYECVNAKRSIFGIDVECRLGGDCSQNPNCYYKQLKRKEQECEELKIYIESNEQQVKEVETLVMDNDRLINELDQLKAQLLDQEAETLKAGEIIHNLKQTLTEIKELCKRQDLNQGSRCIHILQKISECEVKDA